jgi:Calx-beta domain
VKRAATFTVTLSASSGQLVSVVYATANGTAIAGSDHSATSGTLSFEPGATSHPISVPVMNDTVDEPTETFVVTLSTPTNGTIADAQRLGTILDDDQPLVFTDDPVQAGVTGVRAVHLTELRSVIDGLRATYSLPAVV